MTVLSINLNKIYRYIYRKPESLSSNYNPASGLMNRADKANARKTIPPMIVTMDDKKKNRKINIFR